MASPTVASALIKVPCPWVSEGILRSSRCSTVDYRERIVVEGAVRTLNKLSSGPEIAARIQAGRIVLQIPPLWNWL
jgi:hypothetical protein